jgi:HME family heavy-metal exporter
VTYGGQFESQQQAMRLILLLSLFSLVGMFVVLYAHFKSGRVVTQILLNIPFALIGAVVGIWFTGGVASVASMVAFITLCGIASRNGIMMLSHYLHLMRYEGERFDQQMIIRGSLERLVPVLMTAGVAALALVPLMMAAGEPGKEILYPVAVVVFSGLFSSTLLDILVTPAVFWRFGGPAARKIFQAECPELLPKIFPETPTQVQAVATEPEVPPGGPTTKDAGAALGTRLAMAREVQKRLTQRLTQWIQSLREIIKRRR